MHSTSFDRPARQAGNAVLRARVDGRAVRCFDTRGVPVDCLGAAISATRDVAGAARTCRSALAYALRNGILAGDCGRSGEPPLLLAHDTFFHRANCFGPGPPSR
jgi:hypothetical protein